MTVEVYKILLAVSGSLLLFFIGLVSFLAKQMFTDSKETIKSLIEIKTYIKAKDDGCLATHQVINKTINEHTRMLNEHDKQIAIMLKSEK